VKGLNDITAAALTGIPVRTSRLIEDGMTMVVRGSSDWPQDPYMIVGVRPDNHPDVIARKIVREGLRDVLAWLHHPPQYLTGHEVLDMLAGRPVWTPHQDGEHG
jgi:hypothetical protein